jgi:hypothetical protein
MRLLSATVLFAAAATLCAAPASAQVAKSYQFCSVVSGIGTDCTYDNVAQCQQNVEGNGGFCKEGSGYDPAHPLGTGAFPQAPNWR